MGREVAVSASLSQPLQHRDKVFLWERPGYRVLGQSVTSVGRDQLCLKGLNKRGRAGLCYQTEKWEISLPADKNEHGF